MAGRMDPIATYNFFVVIDGWTVAQFKECDGLSIKIKVIEHREQAFSGGKGLPTAKKMPGSIIFEDLVLRRGKITDKNFWDWIYKVQTGKVNEARTTGTIMLMDYGYIPVSKFKFKEGWPSMVDVGKLQAGSDTILLESLTITHEGLEVEL